MYFPDLSRFAYGLQREMPGALNIGWLSKDEPFDIGSLPRCLQDKLKILCLSWGHPDLRHRGHHFCDLCLSVHSEGSSLAQKQPFQIVGNNLGSSLFVVPSVEGDVVFVSPNLIIHYVEEHSYLPPKRFVDAVEMLDFKTFNPKAVWEELVNRAV